MRRISGEISGRAASDSPGFWQRKNPRAASNGLSGVGGAKRDRTADLLHAMQVRAVFPPWATFRSFMKDEARPRLNLLPCLREHRSLSPGVLTVGCVSGGISGKRHSGFAFN